MNTGTYPALKTANGLSRCSAPTSRQTANQLSATTAIPDNAAPTAAFSTSGSGLTYSFDASASIDSDGTVDDYFWDFGDGTSATGITVSHIFPAGNEYAVVLRVTDNDGAEDYTSSTSAIGSVGQYIASSVSLTSAVTLAGPLHTRRLQLRNIQQSDRRPDRLRKHLHD